MRMRMRMRVRKWRKRRRERKSTGEARDNLKFRLFPDTSYKEVNLNSK